MNYQEYISINPEIMVGKPTIKGTRITVELIIKKLGEGATIDELLVSYPRLNKEEIYAALQYAAAIFAREETLA